MGAQGPVAAQAAKASQPRSSGPRPAARSGSESATLTDTLLPSDISRIARFSGAEQMESEARSESARVMSMHAESQPAANPEQAARLRPAAPSMTHTAPTVSEALGSPAVRMRRDEREFFENRFGYDLNEVRLHTDTSANRSARALRALAYAAGNDIVFASGMYAPGTTAGQQLMAHELAHVIQQSEGRAWGIQRQPAPDASVDAGAPPDAATPTEEELDQQVDTNELAARADDPSLAQIDRGKQTTFQNEDAVKGVVLKAFGGEDELNKRFESLSPFVIAEVDRYAGADPKSKTANRTQFLVRMRLYFKSWAETLDHFRHFVKVKRGPVDVVLHEDAAARLNRALDVLERKKHPFPAIGVGFGLRGFHQGEFQTPGYMIHAMGYALDVAATENPKIGFLKAGDPGKQDPFQLSSSIDPKLARIDMDKFMDKRGVPGVVEEMGKRTATDTTLSAADDKDPETRKYFDDFAAGFEKMRSGSLEFLGTISDNHKKQLLKLRADYLDTLRDLAAKKAKKGPPAEIAALEAKRRTLLAQIPPLVTEWIQAIDAEISKTLAAHPGMAKMRSPTEISNDLKTAQANLAAATKNEAQAAAAKARALAERDAARAAFDRAIAAEGHTPNAAAFKKSVEAAAKARERLFAKMDAILDPILAEQKTQTNLTGATESRDKLAAELKTSDDPKLRGTWSWLTNLRELREALAKPDLSTDRGLKAFEELTTGNLSRIAPADNPPLLRMLEAGFFNPKGAFDLEFFEELIHSGFWAGVTWQFGSVDPMHFELLEGRMRIQSPGRFPPR